MSDSGLEDLIKLPSLKNLDLSNTQVTDAGLEQLQAVEHLEILNLTGAAFRSRYRQAAQSTSHTANLLLKRSRSCVSDYEPAFCFFGAASWLALVPAAATSQYVTLGAGGYQGYGYQPQYYGGYPAYGYGRYGDAPRSYYSGYPAYGYGGPYAAPGYNYARYATIYGSSPTYGPGVFRNGYPRRLRASYPAYGYSGGYPLYGYNEDTPCRARLTSFVASLTMCADCALATNQPRGPRKGGHEHRPSAIVFNSVPPFCNP